MSLAMREPSVRAMPAEPSGVPRRVLLASAAATSVLAAAGALHMARRGVSLVEANDLAAFRKPLGAIPAHVEAAIAGGVIEGPAPSFADAWKLLEPEGDGITDGVFARPDGGLVVACRTDMPGVIPEMWDWWMGWHGVSTERYKLWHPRDHVWSAFAEDRSHVRDLRACYVGNDTHVDEYIGPDLHKLTISFRPPEAFGLDPKLVDRQGTAICARTGLRNTPLNIGRLIHLVRRTDTGCEMLSRFWIGDVGFAVPLAGEVDIGSLQTPAQLRALVPPVFGQNLLRHCAEEMNHLAMILPALFDKFGRI